MAQPAVSEQYRDWALVCPKVGACRLAQTLMSAERVWLGTVMLHPAPQGTEGRMADIFVPLGAHFPSGIYVERGSDVMQRGEWVHCVDSACEAQLVLDAAGEGHWRAGVTAELRYRPSPGAPVVRIDISLLGVTAGLEALDALEQGGR